VKKTVVPGIVRRVVVDGERMMLCEFTLDHGAVIAPHSHPHEQVGYVASGRIRVTAQGRTVEIGPGEGYMAPPDAEHSAVALEPSVVIDTFSPPREDYR
jgi:quercetin dioxygenase-like cupin family protein